jgi:hypothetical protein
MEQNFKLGRDRFFLSFPSHYALITIVERYVILTTDSLFR